MIPFRLTLLVMVIAPVIALGTPIPKAVIEAEKEKYRKLREKYDQKVKSLDGTTEGEILKLRLLQAKVMAEATLSVDDIKDPAYRERYRERQSHSLESSFKSDPDLRDMYLLWCYELKNAKSKGAPK